MTTMQLDVAQFDNIQKFVDEFLAKDEPLHILINNAGIMYSLTLGFSACKMASSGYQDCDIESCLHLGCQNANWHLQAARLSTRGPCPPQRESLALRASCLVQASTFRGAGATHLRSPASAPQRAWR